MSEFGKYLKAARILRSDQLSELITVSTFPHMSKSQDKSGILKKLKMARQLFLEKPLKDYKEVASNLAKRLRGG